MASSSAVQSKARFFHFPIPSKFNKEQSPEAPADGFDAKAPAQKLNKLPKAKPQPLSQGDEQGKKGGLLDCFGILGVLALCCICCEGSGNAGYGRRRGWANTPKNQGQPPAPPPQTGNAPSV